MYQHPSEAPLEAESSKNECPTDVDKALSLKLPVPHGLRLGTLDVKTLGVAILLLIIPLLMISNVASFSTPPPFQLRVGGSLQIQHWLAIIGVEFSTLFGTLLVPSVGSILISQYVTKQLMSSGLKLSALLNSHQGAPFSTQLCHGIKRILGIRLALPIFGVALGIAYKFSFETMSMDATIRISDVMLVEAGYLPVHIDGPVVFSTNLLDILGIGDETSVVFKNSSQTLIVGPALDLVATKSLLRGVLHTCHLHYYDRYTFSSSPTPSIEKIGNNNIRIPDSSGGQSVVDISFAADGSLAAGISEPNQTANTTNTIIYAEFVTVVRQICAGYVSWSMDDLNPISILQDPQNDNCTHAPLDQTGWQSSPISNITLTLMGSMFPNTTAATGGKIYGVTDAMTDLQYIVSYILATIPATDDASPEGLVLPTIAGTVCGGLDELPYGGPETLIVNGLIADFGSGMTILGVVLQALVALFAFLVFVSLFWTTPALITTWPAQWFSLLSEFDPYTLRDTIRGTSIGLNAAQGSDVVFLSSRRTSDEVYPRLALSGTMGIVEIGKKHF